MAFFKKVNIKKNIIRGPGKIQRKFLKNCFNQNNILKKINFE
jgi:hypothetical protein